MIYGCPRCGERRYDMLIFGTDDEVVCWICNQVYRPGDGPCLAAESAN